ncbi:hypothetical protein K1I87_01220 [Streptococcus gordonii]|uniref:DUF7678 domain-containing protein n=1 Tax=Streptococcus gordonii TaxID=1302 RepID=UPI001CBB0E66|nr:hypothetical protein [Streptococcus gordonii]MBZ2134830.1 hypothetical protein [Streptococcus gordonii]
MWQEGIFTSRNRKVVYLAKVSTEPFEDGIDNGRIFKLGVDVDGEEVISCDRGWEMYPEYESLEEILDLILERFPA